MQFADRRVYVVLALALLVVALLISLWVENTRFGMALTAIKQNEPAAEAAGINTWRWKMLALMLSGALAAVAGGLYGVVHAGRDAGERVRHAGLGAGADPGAVRRGRQPVGAGDRRRGAGAVGRGAERRTRRDIAGHPGRRLRRRDHRDHPAGAGGGLLAGARSAVAQAEARTAVPRAAASVPTPAEARASVAPLPRMPAPQGRDLLVLRDIGISFGGLRALDGIDLVVPEGGLYGIIGPNGAGKTTLFNVINGFLTPDRGTIQLRRGADYRAAPEPGLPPRHRPHVSGRARLLADDGARKRHRRRLCRRRATTRRRGAWRWRRSTGSGSAPRPRRSPAG